jgi:GTP-binding protein
VKIQSAEFITSAATAAGVPRDGVPQVALVGRSNVGKSSLINALVRRTIARASAAPGKTRLINLYRVEFDRFAPVNRLYLADLPGFGYARGGEPARAGFAALMEQYFGLESPSPAGPSAALLLVDARHPGLPQDLAAWEWMHGLGRPAAVVATKIDKLSRAERKRALNQWTQHLKVPVLAASAATGEGLDELWTLIVRLLLSPRTRIGTANDPSSASAPTTGIAPASAIAPQIDPASAPSTAPPSGTRTASGPLTAIEARSGNAPPNGRRTGPRNGPRRRTTRRSSTSPRSRT